MLRNFLKNSFSCLVCLLLLGACHADNVNQGVKSNMSVASVQKHIKKGMSGEAVLVSLGSPNVISTDDEGREVWVYDKIATEGSSANNSNHLSILFAGISSGSSSYNSSQKTLTVVIKFDANKKVRDFAYHTSRF